MPDLFVCARLKPNAEPSSKSHLVTLSKNTVAISRDPNLLNNEMIQSTEAICRVHKFTFDAVYGCDTQQETIYQELLHPVVEGFLHGQSANVFVVGQSGSGRTYSLHGVTGGAKRGIIPRALETIFDGLEMELQRNSRCVVLVSHVLVFDDCVVDLLSDPTGKNNTGIPRSNLNITASKTPGKEREVEIGNLIRTFDTPMQWTLEDPSDIYDVLQRAKIYKRKQSKVRSDMKYPAPPISHSIITISVINAADATGSGIRPPSYRDGTKCATLTFVDVSMGGKQSIDDNDPKGPTMEVLKGPAYARLLAERNGLRGETSGGGGGRNNATNNTREMACGHTLGTLAMCLTQLQLPSPSGNKSHISFRDCRLTRVLQHRLLASSTNVVLLTLGCSMDHQSASLSAMAWAERLQRCSAFPIERIAAAQRSLESSLSARARSTSPPQHRMSSANTDASPQRSMLSSQRARSVSPPLSASRTRPQNPLPTHTVAATTSISSPLTLSGLRSSSKGTSPQRNIHSAEGLDRDELMFVLGLNEEDIRPKPAAAAAISALEASGNSTKFDPEEDAFMLAAVRSKLEAEALREEASRERERAAETAESLRRERFARSEMSSAVTRCALLETKMAEKERELTIMKRAKAELEEAYIRLEGDVRELREQAQQHLQQRKQLEQMDILKHTIKRLQSDLDAANEEIKRHTEARARLVEEITTTRQVTTELNAKATNSEIAKEEAVVSIETLKRQIGSLQKQVETTQQALTSQQHENRSLLDEIAWYKGVLEARDNERQSNASTVATSKQQCEVLRSALSDAQTQNTSLVQRLDEAQSLRHELESTVQSLKSELSDNLQKSLQSRKMAATAIGELHQLLALCIGDTKPVESIVPSYSSLEMEAAIDHRDKTIISNYIVAWAKIVEETQRRRAQFLSDTEENTRRRVIFEERIAAYEKRLARAAAEEANLRDQKEELLRRVERLTNECDAARLEATMQDTEIRRKREEVARLTSELSVSQAVLKSKSISGLNMSAVSSPPRGSTTKLSSSTSSHRVNAPNIHNHNNINNNSNSPPISSVKSNLRWASPVSAASPEDKPLTMDDVKGNARLSDRPATSLTSSSSSSATETYQNILDRIMKQTASLAAKTSNIQNISQMRE